MKSPLYVLARALSALEDASEAWEGRRARRLSRHLERAQEALGELQHKRIRLGPRPMPRVLATGVDALVYTAPLYPFAELAEQLEGLRREAHTGEEPLLEIDTGDHVEPLLVWPYGTRSGYRWLLQGENMNLGITDAEHMHDQALKVEIPAEALWTLGPRNAYTLTRRVVARLFKLATDEWPAKVSRLDLAIDFQGWAPEYDFLQSIVTRAVQRRAYLEEFNGCTICGDQWATGGRFCYGCGAPAALARRPGPQLRPAPEPVGMPDMEHYFDGLSYTGFRFGSGKTLLNRLYNKTIQMARKCPGAKLWMHDAWEKQSRARGNAFDAEEDVWRLEAQLRRPVLHELELEGTGRTVETVDEALDHANTIMRYVIGGFDLDCHRCGEELIGATTCGACGVDARRSQGWIELREPGPAPNPQRTYWPLAPEWAALQKVDFDASLSPTPSLRITREAGDTQRAAQMAQGGVARIASNLRLLERWRDQHGGEAPTDEQLFGVAVEALRHFTETDDDELTFVKRVEKKDQRRSRAATPRHQEQPSP